jgi:Spy/CpxP family protein refolding chaperone
MIHPTNHSSLIRSFLTLTLAVALWAPFHAHAAERGEGKMMMMMTNSTEGCQAMMDKKAKLTADIKTQDEKLATQVAAMNKAPEGKKLGLMAAIVTSMAENQTAMNAKKAKMEDAMMKHMMGHMEMGAKSMEMCPMMGGMDDKSTDAKKGHHPESK